MADKHFFQKMLTAAAGDTRAGTNFCVMIYDDMGADQSKGEAHAKHYCIGERQRFIFTDKRFVHPVGVQNLCLRPPKKVIFIVYSSITKIQLFKNQCKGVKRKCQKQNLQELI